MTKIME